VQQSDLVTELKRIKAIVPWETLNTHMAVEVGIMFGVNGPEIVHGDDVDYYGPKVVAVGYIFERDDNQQLWATAEDMMEQIPNG
jgi:hypothetical protein